MVSCKGYNLITATPMGFIFSYFWLQAKGSYQAAATNNLLSPGQINWIQSSSPLHMVLGYSWSRAIRRREMFYVKPVFLVLQWSGKKNPPHFGIWLHDSWWAEENINYVSFYTKWVYLMAEVQKRLNEQMVMWVLRTTESKLYTDGHQ